MLRYLVTSILDALGRGGAHPAVVAPEQVSVQMTAADQCRSKSSPWRWGYLKALAAWWKREHKPKAA